MRRPDFMAWPAARLSGQRNYLRKNPALEDAEQYALVWAEEGKSACTGGVACRNEIP